jgi:lipopolysaccharide export system permease protein
MSPPGRTLYLAAVNPALPARARPRSTRLSATLSAYLARQMALGIGIALFGLATLAFVVDAVELLRRASSRPEVELGLVLWMAWLHLPFLIQKLMPFAVLFGTLLCFHRLTRSHELVAVRGAGISVWQFLLPALAVTLTLGAATVLALNPLASAMVARFAALDQKHLSSPASLVAIAPGGLWLRQRDQGEDLLLHARQMQGTPPVLGQVTAFLFDDQGRFISRIDAPRAHLGTGYWELTEPVVAQPDGSRETRAQLRIPTDLTLDRIQDSFAAPETLSFWDLPRFIRSLEAVGLSAREHRLYWHGLLALPLLLCALLLIGTAFALRLVHRGGAGPLIAGGLLTGFVLYVVSDVVFAIGLSGRLPTLLAAWSPAGIAVLLGVTTLLHLEDG